MSSQGVKSTMPRFSQFPDYQKPNKSEFIRVGRTPLYRYLEQVIKQESYLGNQGLELDDSDGDKKRVHIDQLYVLPKLSKKRVSTEEFVKAEAKPDEHEPLTLLNVADVLKGNPRTIILGDPGVGKTTLLQWLLCSLCHWSDNYVKKHLGALFPLRLITRNLPTELSPISDQAFIELILRSQGDSLAALILDNDQAQETLLQLFKLGQVLLLVDGLDEISQAQSQWLSKQIMQLLTGYPSTRLLMTSRVIGFDNKRFWFGENKRNTHRANRPFKDTLKNIWNNVSTNDLVPDVENWMEHKYPSFLSEERDSFSEFSLPVVFYLMPFLAEQRGRFAKNWVEQYLPPNKEQREEFVENIKEINQDLAQLDALSRVPVLLNLISFIQWRRGSLPHGRAELYRRIVGTYLESMDKARKLKFKPETDFDYQDIRNWLGKLAYCMHAGRLPLPKQSLKALNEDELERVREALPEVGNTPIHSISYAQLKLFFDLQLTEILEVDEVDKYSAQLIEYLQRRTGFFIPKGNEAGEEVFGFSHLSFQEYFCAYYISVHYAEIKDEQAVFDSLIESTNQASWEEIWQLVFEEFAAQGKSRKQADKIYKAVFPEQEVYSETRVGLEAKIITNVAVKLSDKQVDIVLNRVAYEVLTERFRLHELNREALNIVITVMSDLSRVQELVKGVKQLFCVGFGEMSWLKKQDNLERLSLFVSSAKQIEKIPDLKIKELNILGPLKALPNLSRFSNVESLSLQLPNLEALDDGRLPENVELVNLVAPTSALMNYLPHLSNLRCCILDNVKTSNLGVLNLKNLTTFGLSNCEIDDWGFLKGVINVQNLLLGKCNIEAITDWSPLFLLENLELLECGYWSDREKLPLEVTRKLEGKGIEVNLDFKFEFE